MNNEYCQELGKQYERLWSEQAVYRSQWQEVALRAWPDRSTFIMERPLGQKRNEWLFDETAALALNKFAAACESMQTPRTSKWHGLRHPNDKLHDNQNISLWMEQATDALFRARYSAKANFASQKHEEYMSIGAFGNGPFFIDDVPGIGIRYKAIHLAEMVVAENHAGQVDTFFRKYKLTARQAYQHWGEKTPEKVLKKMQDSPHTTFEFLHVVMPRQDIEYGNKTFKGMPIASYDILVDGYQFIDESGYRTCPYTFGRYITTPNSVYGYGPAMLVLPATKMLNEMEKTQLRAGQLMVNPPLMLQEDGALSMFDMRPGALNRGALDDQGRPMVAPLDINAKLNWGEEKMEQKRKVVNDAFLVTLFQILVETPEMTATEALLRAQEKGQLLAPTMGRMQSDDLGPQIHRELDILSMAGLLPPMPPEMLELGAEYEVEYTSPLMRLQRSEEGVAILRTIEAITPIAQYDPSVLQTFNADEMIRTLAEVNGMPFRCMRTREQMAALKQQQAQMAQAQALLQAAPVMAGAAKDFAQAQQIGSQGTPAVEPAYAMGR